MIHRLRTWISSHRDQIGLFIGFMILYAITAGRSLKYPSVTPHYAYLAESLLHGVTYFISPIDSIYDPLIFEGQQYSSGGPLPSLAYIPIILLRGTPQGFPDAVVTVVWGALNVVLVYNLLGKLGQWTPVSRETKLALSIVFGAGTPHWYLASLGTMWFAAHVAAVTFVCLYAGEVIGRNRGWQAGLWLGLAGLARPTSWFAFPFFAVMAFYQSTRDRRLDFRSLLSRMIPFTLTLAACGGMAFLYNYARFGSFLDFGYDYVVAADNLAELQVRYGTFHPVYSLRNLRVMLLQPPVITQGTIQPSPWGMSIFLTTPTLLLGFRAIMRRRFTTWLRLVRHAFQHRPAVAWQVFWRFFKFTPLTTAASITVLSVTTVLAFYHNTGSYQFGYRYILDWLPVGMLLIAIGFERTKPGWGWLSVAASVLINLWGVLWIYPTLTPLHEPWHRQWLDLLSWFSF